MGRSGDRVVFIADGHDAGGSLLNTSWRTPTGHVLIEGCSYEKEWISKQRLVRIDADGTETYRDQGDWEIVSEALDYTVGADEQPTREAPPRGRSVAP